MPFAYTPSDANSADFSPPWCSHFQTSPTWEPIPTISLTERPGTGGANSLLATTLSSPRGVRAIRTYFRRDGSSSSTPLPPGTLAPQPGYPPGLVMEVAMLWSLGDGVNGVADTCHGGLIALMLDEVTGEVAAERLGRERIVTGGLSVRYERRLTTPGVVLCRARFREGGGKGRKVIVEGTVEDGVGGVFAKGEAVYIRLKDDVKL